jgi:hypothetical protein
MLWGSVEPSSALELGWLVGVVVVVVVVDGGWDLLANHVEVDHGGDVDRIVLVCLCEILGSEEALLFSCESSECD